VAATKQLADAGYKVFVVGFGSAMPTYLKNTLNWMAWYGGEDNPFPDPITGLGNQGSVTAYNIPLGCNDIVPVTSACCNLSTNATACFPSGITSGQTDSSTIRVILIFPVMLFSRVMRAAWRRRSKARLTLSGRRHIPSPMLPFRRNGLLMKITFTRLPLNLWLPIPCGLVT
jgi:hypothetical protein